MMKHGIAALFMIPTVLLLSLCGIDASAQDRLVAVAVILKHGTRQMLQNAMNDLTTRDPKCRVDLGQITHIGRHQQFLLGRQFYLDYVQREKLIDQDLIEDQVIVKAAGTRPTVESAEALVLGFAHPGTGPSLNHYANPPVAVRNQSGIEARLRDAALPFYQKLLPIRTSDLEGDRIYSPHTSCTSLENEDDALGSEFEKLEAKHRGLYSTLERLTAVRGWDLDKAVALYDNIVSAEGNACKVAIRLPPEVVQQLKDALLDYVENKMLYSELKRKMLLHFPLSDIVNFFGTVVHTATLPTVQPRLLLYELQDVHIWAMLKSFGWKLSGPVPFSSAIIFELRRTPSGEYLVAARYNGAELDLQENRSYDRFARFISGITFGSEVEYFESCSSKTQTSAYLIVYVISGVVVLVLLVAICISIDPEKEINRSEQEPSEWGLTHFQV